MITVATVTRRDMVASKLPLYVLIMQRIRKLPTSEFYYLSPTPDGQCVRVQLPEHEFDRLMADREKPSELLERF